MKLKMIVESLLEDLLFSVKSNKPHFHQDHSLCSHLIPDQLLDLTLQLYNRLKCLKDQIKSINVIIKFSHIKL